MQSAIQVRGAYRNNLKSVDLDIPLGSFTVVTGLSGSGKSSLAFDTIYAEGQRRYVETFSAYTRQFLERMDKPHVESIEGIPPAIAVDQTNPVRTSRSTVGTMTELADHLKLLWAHAADLHCRECGRIVRRDTPESVWATLAEGLEEPAARPHDYQRHDSERHDNRTPDRPQPPPGSRAQILFRVKIPENRSAEDIREVLEGQGYHRFIEPGTPAAPPSSAAQPCAPERAATALVSPDSITVIQDRLRFTPDAGERWREAIETAMLHGNGHCFVHFVDDGLLIPFSAELHCPHCDISYADPIPNSFSFNSPIGACPTCRGFGRTMGIDYELVIPDGSLSLADGAVKVWESKSYSECKSDMLRFARKAGIRTDIPWAVLRKKEQRWVIEGEGDWDDGKWYGLRRFFDWLETKSYKMHIRVLLSRYRAYRPCSDCGGARLKPESLLWKVRSHSMHDVNTLPIDTLRTFFDEVDPGDDEAARLVLDEIRTRLAYLGDVGVGYLTLDRQSRTLSGGEVQRINLTTALGTRLTNTLFVLDEPSIGLHSRDIDRLIAILRRLCAGGNTLLVVEHDPQVIVAAQRVVELGPGAGSDGGSIIFEGTPHDLRHADTPTGRWLACAAQGGKEELRKEQIDASRGTSRASDETGGTSLVIRGASEHNLKIDSLEVPLGCFVSVTGVSGSGKSTLIEDTLYRALLKYLGEPSETPGAHVSVEGCEAITGVVMVDQSSIGKTARSNPASYVGAFDEIRSRFAAAPRAGERGYTTGTFSFNAGNGRCPTCGGTGFEHIEMQFLSDVYLRCPDCEGSRYRPEILDVTIPAAPQSDMASASIADILAMPVADAARFFADDQPVLRKLQPLVDVGLEYVTLGQPVPTLSGGEAQRLKLAAHLAEATGSRTKRSAGKSRPAGETHGPDGEPAPDSLLFLFDEPTTGLHAHDVHRLMGALRHLIGRGHSVIVIEHNLDVIDGSDWIIDIGPEGGHAGGRIVDEGTPDALATGGTGYTAEALRAHRSGRAGEAVMTAAESSPAFDSVPAVGSAEALRPIGIAGAREHNLRNISLEIPQNTMTVLSGVSGSGKSTLAFDILFAEGQRRYLESLNAYARQFVQPAQRPDVDSVYGLPPAVAIEQRTSRGGWKSTVATTTELFGYLRLLFLKLGTQYCPECQVPIEPRTKAGVLADIMRDYGGRRIELLAPLISSRKGYYTDLAGWAAKKGYTHLRVDGEYLPTGEWPRLSRYQEHTIELPVREVLVAPGNEGLLERALEEGFGYGENQLRVIEVSDDAPVGDPQGRLFSIERSCPSCGRSFPELDPRLFSFNSRHGACEHCHGAGYVGVADEDLDAAPVGNSMPESERLDRCSHCGGSRLNAVARSVLYRDVSIDRLSTMSVDALHAWVAEADLSEREAAIARDIFSELSARLSFLRRVGLGYLGLDRAAPTLSGGEAQRIRLAAQLGSNLRGVCYVLDEPTIGLHSRDNRMLLETLTELRDRGNTIVVVEHDADTIRAADYVVDLGPGGGVRGGHIVTRGSVGDMLGCKESRTGRALAHPPHHPAVERGPRPEQVGEAVSDGTGPGPAGADTDAAGADPAPVERPLLRIAGAHLHNLKNIDVEIPLGRLTCITGVSGCGKSSLARGVLRENASRVIEKRRSAKKRGRSADATRTTPRGGGDAETINLSGCSSLSGMEAVDRVLEVDQTPIGKTPRSCPATYVGIWNDIRKLFAGTPEAKLHGFDASRFSFNTSGGRCETCGGQGVVKIEMSFLPDVRMICETCGGRRFTEDTLTVRYKGRSITDVLEMSVEEAVDFFSAHSRIHYALALLEEVGLGYLKLGQQSPTLSGGEAQRLKLVTELAKAGGPKAGHTLYVLDEPTIGLHISDVERLTRVLIRLVDAGNSVVVVEHNLDLIAEADQVIDLGPEGGDEGGYVVACGPPLFVASSFGTDTALEVAAGNRWGYTARALASHLREAQES